MNGSSKWVSTGQPADTLKVSDAIAAFITPEAAQTNNPNGLNGDGDAVDRVLQIYELDAGNDTATPAARRALERHGRPGRQQGLQVQRRRSDRRTVHQGDDQAGQAAQGAVHGRSDTYALNPPGQGSMALTFNGAGSAYCASFSGPAVSQDTPATTDGTGAFHAKDAAAPATCPLP